MSFTDDVKTELCNIRPNSNLIFAEMYGMLLFCRAFSFNEIKLQTTSKQAAERFALLLRQSFDIFAETKVGGTKKPCYRVIVSSPSDRKKILFHYGYKPTSEICLNKNFLKTEGSIGAFLRGVFLSGGVISNPEKEYRIDFNTNSRELAQEFGCLLEEKGLVLKMSQRTNSYCVYSKRSEEIEDLLTIMGAGGETLNLINIKIYKSVRNRLNRVNNFETSNILKTADAAFVQKTAIEKYQKMGKLETLPEELLEVAILRLENPDLSLSALSKLSKAKLTRSGINHRMKKLLQIINEE
ncbi:MAG: DNA-binding protein WhiA [Clostridia bacterium]|nr:DNA-binding protein WhiA [Clostridia bacterium]